MYTVKETIVVEGIYDKIKLSRFIDGVIFVTHGFQIFHNKNQITALKTLAEKTGVVLFTDSDTAGFKIRNFLKQQLPGCVVLHAYIPDVPGKEKRKTQAGKEGLLGVEGISDEILIKALQDAGCTIDGDYTAKKQSGAITKADLYADGLCGTSNSAALRQHLQKVLGLPCKMSSNMLLDVLNRLFCYEEYKEFLSELKDL